MMTIMTIIMMIGGGESGVSNQTVITGCKAS